MLRVIVMVWFASLIVLALTGVALLRWGMQWGSRAEERARTMPGDAYLMGGPRSRVVMTRAISIDASPDRVWPWLCQLGRGAGWYSIDWLDNGGKRSAQHVVSWIPAPELGDATGIGYLRHIDPGRALVWWLGGGRFLGSRARMVTCLQVSTEGRGARVVSRISADFGGLTAVITMLVFGAIDSTMAIRQLLGLRARVEYCEHGGATPKDPETGERDQYQLYEILYAAGGGAGVEGKERGSHWRKAAIEDGVLRG